MINRGLKMITTTESTRTKLFTNLVIFLAAILLVGLSWGRWSAPLAAWLGPALFIRFYRDQKPGRGYLFLLAGCIASTVIGWWQVFPIPINLFIYTFYGLLMTIPYLADRLLTSRLRGFATTLVYPLAAVSLEFINRRTNPIGDWGAIGYTQYGNLALMQIVSVTGMVGITFLMGWSAAVANWVWERYRQSRSRQARIGTLIFGVMLVTVFTFGFLRLVFAPLPATTIRVAGVMGRAARDVLISWQNKLPNAADAHMEVESIRAALFEATIREARAGAKIVVWPEGVGVGFTADEAGLIDRGRDVARREGIYLTIPLYTIYPGEKRPAENKLLVVDPAGEVEFEHIKYGGNLIEGTLSGDKNVGTVRTPFGVLAGVICWDMDFPQVIRQAGQAGAGIWLIPSSDWREITPLHSQMAAFRAVENGLSIVRQAGDGLSIATDPYGHTLAQVDYFSASDRTMVAQVPTVHIPTIYDKVGDAPGWISLIGFSLMLAWALFKRPII
jgi:apolipoprotein N-acyltransferase